MSPLLFLAYVNDIWSNLKPTIKLFADDRIIYRKIMNDGNIETLPIDLDRTGRVGGRKCDENKSR